MLQTKLCTTRHSRDCFQQARVHDLPSCFATTRKCQPKECPGAKSRSRCLALCRNRIGIFSTSVWRVKQPSATTVRRHFSTARVALNFPKVQSRDVGIVLQHANILHVLIDAVGSNDLRKRKCMHTTTILTGVLWSTNLVSKKKTHSLGSWRLCYVNQDSHMCSFLVFFSIWILAEVTEVRSPEQYVLHCLKYCSIQLYEAEQMCL